MPLLFPVTLHFILNELFLESEGFDLKLIIRIIVRDLYTLEICSRLQHCYGKPRICNKNRPEKIGEYSIVIYNTNYAVLSDVASAVDY